VLYCIRVLVCVNVWCHCISAERSCNAAVCEDWCLHTDCNENWLDLRYRCNSCLNILYLMTNCVLKKLVLHSCMIHMSCLCWQWRKLSGPVWSQVDDNVLGIFKHILRICCKNACACMLVWVLYDYKRVNVGIGIICMSYQSCISFMCLLSCCGHFSIMSERCKISFYVSVIHLQLHVVLYWVNCC